MASNRVRSNCAILSRVLAAEKVEPVPEDDNPGLGHPEPAAGRELMVKLIESLSAGVPRPLVEIAKLGRTLSKRDLLPAALGRREPG